MFKLQLFALLVVCCASSNGFEVQSSSQDDDVIEIVCLSERIARILIETANKTAPTSGDKDSDFSSRKSKHKEVLEKVAEVDREISDFESKVKCAEMCCV